jgi:hypothetical protein
MAKMLVAASEAGRFAITLWAASRGFHWINDCPASADPYRTAFESAAHRLDP